MPRGGVRPAFATLGAASAFGITACSVLLDWSGYTGGVRGDGAANEIDATGAGDANESDAAGAHPDQGSADGGLDAPPGIATCGDNMICAPMASANWTGPLILYESAGASPPACGAGYMSNPEYEGNGGLSAPPPTCGACSCGGPTGVACSAPMLSFYSDGRCQNPCGEATSLAPAGTCVKGPWCGAWYRVSATAPAGGACQPMGGGMKTLPPTTWAMRARACTPQSVPAQGSCGSGQLCLPTPAPPFRSRFCVKKDSVESSCPAAFSDGPRHYYGDQITDSRTCSDCACGPPDGGSCGYSTFPPDGFPWFDSNCLTPGNGPLASPTNCAAVTVAQSFGFHTGPELDAGTCAPSGGEARGQASPTAGVTFCCTP